MPARPKIRTRPPLFFLGAALLIFPLSGQSRPWQNKEGSQFEGDLLGVEDQVAVIQRQGDYRLFRIPVLSLALVDQQFVGKQMKDGTIGSGLTIPLAESLQSSLKGHYRFDEKGSLGVDSSGNRARSAAGDCKMDWNGNGLLNGAASFNGRNSIFWMRMIMPLKNQPLTVSCWIKTSKLEEQEIYSHGRAVYGFTLYTENRNTGFVYRWNRGKGTSEIRFSRKPVTDGEWHHLCAIADEKGTISFWVDGERAGLRAGELLKNEPLRGATMGSVADNKDNIRHSQTTTPFAGLIDEFMIFDRALTEFEVKDLYKRYKPFAKD